LELISVDTQIWQILLRKYVQQIITTPATIVERNQYSDFILV